MTCVHSSSLASCTLRQFVLMQLSMEAAALAATLLLSARLPAQQQSSPGAPLSVPAMRVPLLQLVQPSSGGSLPTDRPVVFFRYGPGEPTDPIDDTSFQVWVDGAERTARFRIGNGEAWGTLAAASSTSGLDSTSPASAPRGGTAVADVRAQLTAGAHLVTARVCSVRGVCSTTHDILTAMPVAAALPDDVQALGLQQRPVLARNGAWASDSTRSERRKRHSHLKQPLTLVGDLVGLVGKLFR